MHPLISTQELLAQLQGPHPPVVLDTRWRMFGPPAGEDYERGHLPEARFVDLDAELAAAPGAGGRHPLPEPAALQRALTRVGVRRDREVVVYDDDNGSVAARAWWLLRWAGHEAVSVLDGGYAAWRANELPVTTDTPPEWDGDFQVSPGHMPVADAAGAVRIAHEGSLLDARTPERYRGEAEPVDPRAGHIPGAVNAPFGAHSDHSGRWRSASELAQHFSDLGVTADRPIGAYCGSGVTACSVLLALEHAGVTTAQRPATLYAGSWSQWCGDPSSEVATGTDPG